MNLIKHYSLLLGLDQNWSVSNVKLNLESQSVDIDVEYASSDTLCPECGTQCAIYDHAPKRTWRHLDTMQFQTLLHAKVPRIQCGKCKIKTIPVPWASKYSRWTLLFEAFAIDILLAAKTLSDARRILRLDWRGTQQIMERAVKHGLERRENSDIPWIRMDEKSFRKGQDYISVLTDIDGKRILDVEEGRDSKVATKLIHKCLNEDQRDVVWDVAMDMSAPYTSAVEKELPHADVVYDRFHIMKSVLEALDKIRRKEHETLMKEGDHTLAKSKYLWLQNPENMTDKAKELFKALSQKTLDSVKAWQVKELFKEFWEMPSKEWARWFFYNWKIEAIKLNLKPMNKFINMIESHLENVINYFDCYITNAITEGFNSKIQGLKANARGFRKFENYRTTILFFCGRLNLSSLATH